MTDPAAVLPKYDTAVVARVILEEVLELHPEHLRADELARRISFDPEDHREIATATQAICDLRESGLFSYDDEDIVSPTPAALLAGVLLAGLP